MADDPMEGAPPADGVVVAPGADAVGTVTDATQQEQAREARETVGRLPRQRSAYQEPKKPQPAAPRESTVEENIYERFLSGPQDSGPDTLERARLNAVNSYYRGSAAGALGLSAMAKVYGEQDPPDMDPDMKKARDGVREKYDEIVADLIAYDLMPTWSGLPQLGAAIGGTVAGALPSPESFLGWAAKGATWTARTMWAGVQQGIISGATDPVIQMLNIDAGVQKEYEWTQTVGAIGFGAVLGSGFHAAGEGLTHIIDQRALRQQLYDISRTDNDLISAEFGIWAQDPRNGIYGERGDLVKPERKVPAPEEYDARVETAKEAVWADKDEMGRVKRGVARNENHATQIAKERVMLEDVPEASQLAADLSGASPEQIREIAQFYRPEKGLTPLESFEKAVDRWTEIQEAAAIRQFDQEDYGLFISPADRDFDTLKAEGNNDPVLRDMYQRLEDYYTGGKVDHDAIPFETGTAPRVVGEVAIPEGGRREGGAPGVEPREGGAPAGGPTGQARAAGEGLAGERVTLRDPNDLVVALKAIGSDGKEIVVRGKPGDLHADVYEKLGEGAKVIDDGGFVDVKSGKYFTREEASKLSGIDEGRVLAEAQEVGSRRIASKDLPEGTEMVLYPNPDTPGFTVVIQNKGAGSADVGAQHYYLSVDETGRVDEAFNTTQRYRGLGESLYEAAIKIAQERGLRLSGFGSEYAQRVWKKLEARGLAEKVGPEQYAATAPKLEQQGVANERGASPTGPVAETVPNPPAPAQARGAASDQLASGGQYLESRGRGIQYHGSAAADLKPSSDHYSTLNYYGQGFYTTDAVDVASGYAKPRGRQATGERHLYEVVPKGELKILDGEAEFPAEVRKVLEPIHDHNGPIAEMLRHVEGDEAPPKNMRELYDRIRDDATAEGYSADSIQEIFDSINYALRELGYAGMSHKGGLRTKRDPHNVVIYFDPERDLQIKEVPFSDFMPPAAPLKTERTSQGEQTLVPGVAPITDADRAKAGMAKPMRGGDAPAGGLFDADARAQRDLLDVQALMPSREGNLMPGEVRRDSDVGIAAPEDFSPGQAASLKSLQQQSVALADAIGVPLRTGRVSVPGALGIYKNRSGVVRVKELADFEVVKHEIGHAIEAKLGKPLTDLIQKNSFELGPLDYDKGKMRPEEGFAEWMRVRMQNPKAAEMQAPTFSNAFDALLITERPDIYQTLTGVAAAHRAWLEAPSVDVAAAVVRDTLPASFREEVREATKEGLPVAVNTILQKGYQKIVDRFAPMERAVRDLARLKQEQQGGGLVDIKAAYDPSVLIRSYRRVGQTAHVETMFGIIPYRQVEPQGASLKDVLNDALGKPFFGRWNEGAIRDFDRYLAVRMSEYLWRRYDEGLIPNAPSPIKPGDARQAMADLEKAYPTFRSAADKLQDFVANVRKKKYESGLWSKDLYDKTAEYEFYVPMKRKFEEGERGAGGAADGSRLGSAVFKRQGSERDIVSPIRNIMLDVLHMEQDIRMNEIRKALGELAESVPGEGGRYAERLKGMEARKYIAPLEDMIMARAKEIGMEPGEARGMIDALLDGEDGPLMGGFFKMEQAATRGEPIVFTWEGGKPVAWRIMSEKAGEQHRLYELMTETPPAILDVWTNIISVGAAALRGGIVNSPTFILTNYIRDQLQVALTRPGYVPFLSGIPGIVSELREGPTSRMRAQYAGVMGGSLVGEVERKFEADITALGKQGYLVKRTGSVREALELMQITEAGTRNSVFGKVYKQKLREGLSPYEAGWEAARQADDIMDFSRHGDRMGFVRRVLPFFNANIQGQDRYTFRQLIEPFLKRAGMQGGMVTTRDKEDLSRAIYAWTMAGAGGIAFGAAWAALNWEKEDYRDASPEVKGTHVVIPLPGGSTLVMPKPFELGIGFSAGEYGYAAWMEKDPRAAKQFAEAVRQSTSPPDPIRNMPLVTPIVELMTNYSFFRQGPIVPDAVRNEANPALEYTERTSSGARWLGEALGWSPIKIDYAMGAFFGTNGRDLMSVTSMADKDTPTQSLDDTMFLRRFVKNDERISGRAKQFWELMGAKNGKYANDAEGYRKLVKEAVVRGQEPVLANQLLDKLPAPERVYVVMKEGANAQGKPAFTADERRLHPLVRAQEAVSVLSGIARDLQSNTLIPYREKERLILSPDQRRRLIDEIQTMAGAEQRNAFAVVGEPGYAGRQVFDVNDYMTVIEKLSPNVAEEIATRYATAKIYDARAVQEAWPTIRDEIMTYGTDANIKGVGARARGAGYQFSGIRAKKPGVLRVPIGGAPPQPAP